MIKLSPTDTTGLTDTYTRDGFVVIRDVFSKRNRQLLERELDRFVRDVAPALPPGEAYFEDNEKRAIKALHNLDRYSEYFAQLHLHPRMSSLVRKILPDGELLGTGTAYFAKLAHVGSVTPPHQDNVFQHYDPPLALTLTVSLSPATPDNGVLICRQGSHRLGVLPHRASDVMGFSRVIDRLPPVSDYPEVPLLLEPGDVSLHHVNTIHYSGANHSGQDRRQFAIGYRSSLAVRDEASYQSYLQALAQLHEEHKTPAGQS